MSCTPARKKRIVILGSTGSVGSNACKVAKALPDKVEVVGLCANTSIDLLAAQAEEQVSASNVSRGIALCCVCPVENVGCAIL